MALYDNFLEYICHLSSCQNVAAAVLISFFIYYYFKVRDLPPGPWGIPFIGYWPFLRVQGGHLHLQEMKEKYGDVFSFTITGNLFVSLSSLKALKEAHLSKSECFGDRFTDYSLLTLSFKEAVSIVNGESWRVQRKFFNQKFREYGMLAVKEDASGSIYDSITETVDEMRAMKGQPIAVSELLTLKCSKIIRRILFNDQGISEEELTELNHEYGPVLHSMTYKNLLLMGNIARYFIFPFIPSYWAMMKGHHHIQTILTNILKKHKAAFDETQVLDIIDCFYKEKKDRERKGDPTAKYFTDRALLSSVYQFVTDGVLTVAFFIALFLQYLVQHPKEQDKIYEELLDVVGPNRQPTIEDKSKLPYTNAFIYEVIRYSDFFPLFPSLKCTRETTLQGYKIPKNALTVVNAYAIHHDPSTYKDPYKFDPTRFITKPDKPKEDFPVMFGIGKRACMGEPFTMIQTFLFVTTIVKNFRLAKPIETDSSFNIVDAEEIKICAHPRTEDLQSKN